MHVRGSMCVQRVRCGTASVPAAWCTGTRNSYNRQAAHTHIRTKAYSYAYRERHRDTHKKCELDICIRTQLSAPFLILIFRVTEFVHGSGRKSMYTRAHIELTRHTS